MSTEVRIVNDTYHYPPDLLNLLADTIPLLNKSKEALLDFFEGAGVQEYILGEHRDLLESDQTSFRKFTVTRAILVELNRRGDPCLRARRELLKRVVEFENYSSCWDDDREKAKLRVFEIRGLVNLKDSVTKIALAEEQERRLRVESARRGAEEKEDRQRRSATHLRELKSLFQLEKGPARGRAAEEVFTKILEASGMQVREPFTLRLPDGKPLEQIDGALSIDGHIYLVEIKWQDEAVGTDLTAQHLVRVYSRSDARGIMFSASRFTSAAIQQVTDALRSKLFILVEMSEIVEALEKEISLEALIRKKVEFAELQKQPFVRPIGVSL